MAYADAIRTAIISGASIASLIEGGLVVPAYVTVSASINTTSGSFTNYTNLSIANTARANDRCLLIGQMKVSVSGASVRAMCQFTEDGVAQGLTGAFVGYRTDTGGEDGTITIAQINTPSAGAHTYRMQWKTSSGTAYSIGAYLTVLMLRES